MSKPKNVIRAQGEIHQFDGTSIDDDGDPMLGFYFRFLDQHDTPITLLMGPYSTAREAELACQREYELSM